MSRAPSNNGGTKEGCREVLIPLGLYCASRRGPEDVFPPRPPCLAELVGVEPCRPGACAGGAA